MVVLFNTEGRFGHQLSQFTTLVAYSKKYDRPFYHWRFESRFARFFSRNMDAILKPVSVKLIFLFCLYKILKLFAVHKFEIFDTTFFIATKKDKNLIFDDTIEQLFLSTSKYVVTDFIFNDVHKLISFREEIKSYLLPNSALQIKTDSFINTFRKQYKVVVGLHIRRDDFKDFENGRFYYNDDDYIKALNQFLNIILLDAKEIVFVICSDEKIDIEKYNSFNISYQQRSFQEDFFILSKCDYIISSRSIFSIMANYISNNKIYQIIDKKYAFTMNDFIESSTLLTEHYNLKFKDI